MTDMKDRGSGGTCKEKAHAYPARLWLPVVPVLLAGCRVFGLCQGDSIFMPVHLRGGLARSNRTAMMHQLYEFRRQGSMDIGVQKSRSPSAQPIRTRSFWGNHVVAEGSKGVFWMIRQRIRECRLFIPISSANTESRLEAYFRREWKLAARQIVKMILRYET